MPKSSRLPVHVLPPVLLGVSLLSVYLSTLAPGLSWANDGSDGGDLIAAAATGGVPHPTGYPLYLLLARAFQLIPVGSLAFRTNVMSALLTVAAALLVYETVVRAVAVPAREHRWVAGLGAGYAFGLAPLVWSQAVITEVYALQALLIALIMYLYGGTFDLRSAPLDGWRGIALGLALSNHITAFLVLPAALLLGSLRQKDATPEPDRLRFANLSVDGAALLRQLGGCALGLSPYLILPLRAMSQPPVNWGNPIHPARWGWLVSGELYRSHYFPPAAPAVWEHVQQAAALLLQQFGILVLTLALVGLIVFWKPSPLYLLTAWTAAVYTSFAIVYGAADWYVYLIPALLCLSIWAGLALAGPVRLLKRRSFRAARILGALLVGFFAWRSVGIVGQVDASDDLRAETFGSEVLRRAPPGAILFADGDQAVFALWYFHFALHERPDVAVLAVDLLHFDWYQETLRATYSELEVPGPFPFPESIAATNPARPACHVRYSDRTEMECTQPSAE